MPLPQMICQTKPRAAKPKPDQPTKTHPVSQQFRPTDFNGTPSSLPVILPFHLLHLNLPIIEVLQCIHYQTSSGIVTLSFLLPSSKSQLFWSATSSLSTYPSHFKLHIMIIISTLSRPSKDHSSVLLFLSPCDTHRIMKVCRHLRCSPGLTP